MAGIHAGAVSALSCGDYASLAYMDRVEEIEAAINDLPPEDFQRIANWFRERDQSLWDQQLDRDAVDGKLDFLFNEVETDTRYGKI